MTKRSIFSVLILVIWFGGCKSPVSDQGANLQPDFKHWIIGKWEGKGAGGLMYLTFNENSIVIIDYSPDGGKALTHPYKLIDDKILEISGYPDNLIIHKQDGEIYFEPEGNKRRIDIDLIYVNKFRKIS